MPLKISRPTNVAPALLILVLLCALAVTVTRASGEETSGTSEDASQDSMRVRDLPGKATATSNTYLLADGSLETQLFQAPVNYKDEDGDWQPIDQTLQQSPDGSVVNGDNSFDVRLPADLDQGPAKVSIGEDWVSQMPIAIGVAPAEVNEGVATYEAAGGAAELAFSALSNGLKENIVLADPSAPSTFHFQLDASQGVTPKLAADGSVRFETAEGDLVASVPAPVMVDDAGTLAPRPDGVIYSLDDDDEDGWQLSVVADPEWLADPGRAWPVTIDPSVTIPAPALDCGIANQGFSGNSFCGTSGWPYLGVKASYKSSGADEYARTLLRFNLSSIPASASINTAKIGIYSPSQAKNVGWVTAWDANQSWDNTVSWKNYATQGGGNQKLPWTTEGGDYGKWKSQTTVNVADRGAQAGWWEFTSPQMAWLTQRWLSGAVPNQGVLLKIGPEEKLRECCIERIVEWTSSASANKPYLSVQYTEPASPDSKITSPTDGTKSAKRFLLTSKWEHSGVEGVTFQYLSEEGWLDIPAAQVIDGSNKQVSWPYPVTKPEDRESRPLYVDASASLAMFTASTKGQIRAVLSGPPGAGGYTKPVEVEFNRDTGSPKDAIASVGPGAVDLLTGNFTVSRSDVSISAFNASLEFSRSFSSRKAKAGTEATGVLGPGWQPASPLEEAGGASWTKVVLHEESEEFEEGETFTYKWATLAHSEGGELAFEEDEATHQFITPPEMSGYVLYRNPSTGNIEFTDPEGNRTVFSNGGSGNEYLPISIAMTGGPGNKSRMIYEPVGGKRRLKTIIAPAAPNISCPDEGATTSPGCRVLAFTYQSATAWGAPAGAGDRLQKITYYAAGQGGPWDVAQYSYDTVGRLTASWDPRISPNLKETYTYNATGQIATLTPPGQEPWTMEYGTTGMDPGAGRLVAVKRATLVPANPTAQTTIAYGVPLTKAAGGPYDMSGEAVAAWGQQDLPTDATAIFPPDEVPAKPPASYARATVYYMDAEGQISNIATESGAGTSAPSITTSETDRFGNVVRELSAQNRLRALTQPTVEAKIAKSRELDAQLVYSADGTELQEERGPMHSVRLESGTTTQARARRTIQYDKGAPVPGPGETKPHLPTTETTGALLSGGTTVDNLTTEYRYNWTLRKPTETIADPGGSQETKSVTVYDPETGLPTEMRQPKNTAGGGAGTTKVVYYKAEWAVGKGELAKCESHAFAGRPCKIEPAAQPGTAGQPNLPVRQFLSFNALGEPLEATEAPPGGSSRKSVATYDAAGRQLTKEIIGGGVPVPKVLTEYGIATGLPSAERFVCPESEPECDRQSSFVTYDKLGRPTTYKDADNNEAKTTYDFLGRPATVNDGKGTQTYRYDSVTRLLVELEDSAAGIFTASYDADGALVKQGLPDGLTRETTYDEAGQASALTYTKATNCGASCTWLNFGVERSIRGQILLESGNLGKDEYAYDKLGRLVTARETPTGGTCITRSYKFDKDSNREEMTTTPGVGGACSSSGGTSQKYSYDSADRLLGEGLTYDDFGRITNLPANLAGGKALATTYFSTDMVATQTQNGVTNTFQLDAMLRPRTRLQAGGLEGTEIFHYASSSDSPAWTERGSIWTRNIVGIGGELAASQESGKEVQLQLTNLHGDVSATAALSPTATELKATLRFDEFGNPTGGNAGRFGWLGGMQRRTELPSGVIQMGARSYIPALGRFLTPDPILGGSANPYDYANQDPINKFDLGGECAHPGHGKCYGPPTPAWAKKAARRMANRHNRPHAVVRTRKCTAIACTVGWGGGGGSDPVGDFLGGVANKVVHALIDEPNITGSSLREMLTDTYGAVSSPTGKKAVSCGDAALKGWQETAGVRAAPVGGLIASILYTATRCVVNVATG